MYPSYSSWMILERYERFVALLKDWGTDAFLVWADSPGVALEVLLATQRDGGQIDQVWLDHDVGAEFTDAWGSTFRGVAQALALMKFQGQVFLHSANPAGRLWMGLLLREHGVKVQQASGEVLARLWGVEFEEGE